MNLNQSSTTRDVGHRIILVRLSFLAVLTLRLWRPAEPGRRNRCAVFAVVNSAGVTHNRDTGNRNGVMPGGPSPETRPTAAEPGGLTVRTVPIADPGDLLTGLPDAPVLSWVRQGRGLVGWGEVARVTLTAGEDRFTAGEKWLRTLFDDVTVDDRVQVPGTGPLAFGSFTFDPASDGSVLIVPRVIVGRDGTGTAWLTTVSDGREPAGRQSWPGAAGPDEEPGPRTGIPSGSTLRWHDGSLSAPRVGARGRARGGPDHLRPP